MRTPTIVLCVVGLLACVLASAAVKGLVVDAQGKPIAGAEVWLAGDRYVEDVGWSSLGHTTTGADGRFVFDYDVKPGRTESCTALAQGHALGWSWAAGPKAYARIVLEPAAPFESKVVDERGTPIAGAKVRLASGDSPFWHGPVNLGWSVPGELADRLTVTTDDHGRFVVPWAWAGARLNLLASAPGYVAANAGWSRTGAPIVLKRAATAVLEGQVTCPEDPAAVKGLKARVNMSAGRWGTARTDDHGRFRITNLPAGLAEMSWETSMSSAWQPPRVEPFALRAGQTKTISVRLVKAAEVDVKVVEKGTGQPLPKAWVNVFGPVVLEWGFTGDHGVGVFHEVPGQGDITISADGPPQNWYDPRRTLAKLSAAEIGRTKSVTIELERAAFINGHVVDEHGRPVAGAVVSCYQAGQTGGGKLPGVDSWTISLPVGTISGEDGSFSLGSLGPGHTYFLLASAEGLMPLAETRVTTSKRVTDVTLKVSSKAWCRIKGKVVDEKGAPVSPADVQLSETAPGPTPRHEFYPYTVRTHADGSFITPKLPAMLHYKASVNWLVGPGNVYGQVSAGAWQGEVGKVHDLGKVVLRGRIGPVQAERPAPPPPSESTVAGRVVDADGKPVAGATVFNRGDGPDKTTAVSDAEGRFRLTGRYAGPVWVFAEAKGFGFVSKLSRSGDENVQVTLPPAPGPGEIGEPRAFNLPDAGANRTVEAQALDAAWQWAKANHMEGSMAWQLVGPAALLRPKLVAEMTPSAKNADAWKAERIAETLLATDPQRAISILRQASGMDWYPTRLALFGRRLVRNRPDLARQVLNEAITRAEAETKPSSKVEALALAGAALLPLDPERGRAAVREAAQIAGGLPRVSMAVAGTKLRDAGGPMARQEAAAALAPIDLAGAMRLIDGIEYWQQSGAKSRIAVAIAAIDPARAEALLKETIKPGQSYSETDVYAICRHMAAVDPDRAVEIARGMQDARVRVTALAVVAQALAKSDPARAAKLFDEVLTALAAGPGARDFQSWSLDWATVGLRAATLAATAGYSRTDEMVARSMALRGDPYGRLPFGEPGALGQGRLAAGWISELLALFDRDGARALLESRYLVDGKVPVGPPPQFSTDLSGLRAAAAIDPAWALKLVEEMPEVKGAERGWNPKALAYGQLVAYLAIPLDDRASAARNRQWGSLAEQMREDL